MINPFITGIKRVYSRDTFKIFVSMYNIYIDKCTYKKYTEVVNKIKRKGKRFLSIIDIETAVRGGD